MICRDLQCIEESEPLGIWSDYIEILMGPTIEKKKENRKKGENILFLNYSIKYLILN